MKLRRPWLIKTLCLLGVFLLRMLFGTIRTKYRCTGRDYRPSALHPNERYIYAIWHEYLLVPLMTFPSNRFQILVSQHTDGSIVAELGKHLRLGLVRGSTTRGGVDALRKLLRPSRYRYVAATPDGPRGPRRRLQLGLIYLAAKTGFPIVVVGIGHQKAVRLKSWDRFSIPLPWSDVVVATSHPIVVPPNASRREMERYRQQAEQALNEVTATAEQVATGRVEQPATAQVAKQAA